MKARLLASSVAAVLLAGGCAAPETIPADDPYASRVVSPNYAQADVRSGYYVDVGSGVTAPARIFVYQSAPASL